MKRKRRNNSHQPIRSVRKSKDDTQNVDGDIDRASMPTKSMAESIGKIKIQCADKKMTELQKDNIEYESSLKQQQQEQVQNQDHALQLVHDVANHCCVSDHTVGKGSINPFMDEACKVDERCMNSDAIDVMDGNNNNNNNNNNNKNEIHCGEVHVDLKEYYQSLLDRVEQWTSELEIELDDMFMIRLKNAILQNRLAMIGAYDDDDDDDDDNSHQCTNSDIN
jgi:hypothetical protein